MKIAKWPALLLLRWSKLKPTWSSLSTKREHSRDANKKWRLTKTKWSANTLNNSRIALTKSRLPRTLLKKPVTPFSKNWKLKRCSAELKRNSRKIFAMNFISRKAKRQPWPRKELRLKSANVTSKSCRRQKISRCAWRPSVLQKSAAWKTNSNRSWWRSLQRTSVSSRWMRKSVVCASWSTDAKSSASGKKSL